MNLAQGVSMTKEIKQMLTELAKEERMKSITVSFGGEMALTYRNSFRKVAHRYYLFLLQNEILL